ncbi:DUF1456 family protein [Flavobacterium agricola]|uniref:DUF1456 family protein n=1 Tax=Flavobacterium agricola TaxID=2870839 RepID=A0ABY6M1J4_9FLAO|nr:DUF1456 family protein [Flavobacterium agricola]UYW02384.1 DUF1456 family protein [Flavobacterium agricola]
MTNNDIFKKLRVALMLRDDQIVEILELVDFRISKGEIGNFFRAEDHPKYVECGDQVLRNFLNALVIHLRGTKEDPKNPIEIIEANKKAAKNNKLENFSDKKPAAKPADKKPRVKTNNAGKPFVKKEKPVSVVEKVKFNNGKPKKK